MPRTSVPFNRLMISVLSVAFLIPLLFASPAKAADGTTVKGKIASNESLKKSWDGHSLEILLPEIKTRLFERIELPPIPFPKNWTEMKPEEQQKWATEFENSELGEKFIKLRETLIDAAHEFDVKIEKDGDFIVYDVPPGIYGLQGVVDKEIGNTRYRFEIFGQIEVLKNVDEIALAPLQLEITPLLEAGDKAPPISVQTYDGKSTLTLDTFKDNYLFLNFWMADSPSASFQKGVQEMYAKLEGKQPLRLLSVCLDTDSKSALKYITENDLKLGSHGFTKGFEHKTVIYYGVRTLPTFYLIAPDGTIAMTPTDFAIAFQVSQDLAEIVENKITGKDTPTPAEPTP